jgi:hypothetical protein
MWLLHEGRLPQKIIRKSGKKGFAYKTDFTCLKQPPKCTRDGYYVTLHMEDFIRDDEHITQTKLDKWGKDIADKTVEALKSELYRI